MSGGHFDYRDRYIDDIAEEIESVLFRQGKLKPKDELWNSKDFYDKYPEEKFYPTLPDEIQQKMKEAVIALRKSSIYAHRIDYFLSGDDGEESFIERLNEELELFE